MATTTRKRRRAATQQARVARPKPVVQRDMSIYARVLRLPGLNGFCALNTSEVENDLAEVTGERRKLVQADIDEMRAADAARPTHRRSATSPADPQIVPELQGSDSILQHHSVRSTADTKADTIQTLESLVFGGERDFCSHLDGLLPTSREMAVWIAHRMGNPNPKVADVNLPKVSSGLASNFLRLDMTLRERLAVLAARREEKDKRYLLLRRQYIRMLKVFQLELKEQEETLDALHAEAVAAARSSTADAAKPSASGTDRLPQPQQLSERLIAANIALEEQNAQLRARLTTALGGASPVFACGDIVETAYGHGIVVQQRDSDNVTSVQLNWGAMVFCNESAVKLLARAGKPFTRQQTLSDELGMRSDDARGDVPSVLTGLHKSSSAEEALKRKRVEAAMARANKKLCRRGDRGMSGDSLCVDDGAPRTRSAPVFTSSWSTGVPRNLQLVLDPLRSNSSVGFVLGLRHEDNSIDPLDGMGSTAQVKHDDAEAADSKHDPLDAGLPTAPTTPGGHSRGEAAAYKAAVHRLKFQLRTAEEARQDQRSRLTEARQTASQLLHQLTVTRASLKELRDALSAKDAQLQQKNIALRRLQSKWVGGEDIHTDDADVKIMLEAAAQLNAVDNGEGLLTPGELAERKRKQESDREVRRARAREQAQQRRRGVTRGRIGTRSTTTKPGDEDDEDDSEDDDVTQKQESDDEEGGADVEGRDHVMDEDQDGEGDEGDEEEGDEDEQGRDGEDDEEPDDDDDAGGDEAPAQGATKDLGGDEEGSDIASHADADESMDAPASQDLEWSDSKPPASEDDAVAATRRRARRTSPSAPEGGSAANRNARRPSRKGTRRRR